MKRLSILRWAVIMLLCLLLMACVPTPNEPVIIGKNTETMLAAAQTETKDETPLAERLGAPVHYQAELVSKGGRLSVTVDADVVVPDAALPILRVNPREFTVEEAQRFASVLLGPDPFFWDGVPDKAYWRERIDKLIDDIAHWDESGMNAYNDLDTVDEARERLAEWNREMAKAPDEPTRIEPDWTLQPTRAWNSEGEIKTTDTYLSFNVLDPSGSWAEFSIRNCRDMEGTASLTYVRDCMHSNPNFLDEVIDAAQYLSVTQEEAEAQAAALLERLGMDDFALALSYGANAFYNDPGDLTPVWTCVFTRTVRGVPTNFANAESAWAYMTTLEQESVYVMIDDSGVFAFRYDSPLEVLEAVTESAALLPFEKVQTQFERMVLLKNNTVDSEPSPSRSDRYVIGLVRLGLVAVREQDKDTVLLVPAWDFLGHSEHTGQLDANTPYTWIEAKNECRSFLTVNAVDGSIIDRAEGY